MTMSRVLATFLVLAGSVHTASAAPVLMKWTIDGVQREALVMPPTATSVNEQHPVIFVFHGHGGAMRSAAAFGFQREWANAIVVCPQGLDTPSGLDPKGRLPGWQRVAGDQGDRDLKFFDVILNTMHKKYTVDDHAVFAVGFSNGAFFSLLLWIERTDVFAGFAVIAGSLEPGQRLPKPKPVVHIAGEKDPKVTPDKAKATIAEELRVNGASERADNCGVGCSLYKGTGADTKVIWHPGGHLIPPRAAAMSVAFFKSLRSATRP